jgi:hypothetical protein
MAYLFAVLGISLQINNKNKHINILLAMKKATAFVVFGLLAITAFAQNNDAKIGEDESSILYIDVPISQPNVNDCYANSTDEIVVEEEWFKLYPNPNQGIFNLEISKLKSGEKMNIKIFNLSGAIIYNSSEIAQNETHIITLNLSTLAKGIYFAHIQVGEKKSVKRLTII